MLVWCPRYPLISLVDREDALHFRPYTTSHSPEVEDLHDICKESLSHSRNDKFKGIEGVYDLWELCSILDVLLGFVVINLNSTSKVVL